MNNQQIEASLLEYGVTHFNDKFEGILRQIIICYNIMIADKVILPNDENKIRNNLVNNYLNNNDIRDKIELKNCYFQPEAPTENDEGRNDIKIISQQATFSDTRAFYNIECKRLNNNNQNGKTGLNGEYISNGIARFVSEKYSMYNNIAGMIGFVVSKMNIHDNTACINKLLKSTFTEISTEKELTKKQIAPDFEYSYYSQHKVNDTAKTIYHLMFDFADNIK
jgi:hypothetical protein